MVRRHYIFHGRVQGVGFRYTLYQMATQLGLSGWVKNLYDGSVEACIQGERSRIDNLIYSLQNQRFIRIERIECEDIDVLASEHCFEVKYY